MLMLMSFFGSLISGDRRVKRHTLRGGWFMDLRIPKPKKKRLRSPLINSINILTLDKETPRKSISSGFPKTLKWLCLTQTVMFNPKTVNPKP